MSYEREIDLISGANKKDRYADNPNQIALKNKLVSKYGSRIAESLCERPLTETEINSMPSDVYSYHDLYNRENVVAAIPESAARKERREKERIQKYWNTQRTPEESLAEFNNKISFILLDFSLDHIHFAQTPENAQVLMDLLKQNGMDITAANLHSVFELAAKNGDLTLLPEAIGIFDEGKEIKGARLRNSPNLYKYVDKHRQLSEDELAELKQKDRLDHQSAEDFKSWHPELVERETEAAQRASAERIRQHIKMFKDTVCPEYLPTENNRRLILDRILDAGGRISVQSVTSAYNELLREGKIDTSLVLAIAKAEANLEQAKQAQDEEAAEEWRNEVDSLRDMDESGQIRKTRYGNSTLIEYPNRKNQPPVQPESREVKILAASPTPKTWTLAQINAMSAEEYAKNLSDPVFEAAIMKFYGGR